jgi:hypothetical protein
MFKPAFLLIPLVLCSCAAPRQENVAARSDDQPADALFPVKVENHYEYMDRTGKVVLHGPYAGASRFSEGLAAVQVKRAEKVGYIDTTGKMVIPLQFDLGDPFSEGFAAAMIDHKWGYIDKTGKIVIPLQFDVGEPFVNGRAAVAAGPTQEYGFINTKGEYVSPGRYTMALGYREGLASVRSFAERFKFIDMDGKVAIPPQFLEGGEFADGLAPVQAQTPEGVRWGFVDKTGKMAIPATYTNAAMFANGLAPVQTMSGKWGFIDTKNTMVINPQWDQAAAFIYGLAQVWLGGNFGYIGTDGKYVREIQ